MNGMKVPLSIINAGKTYAYVSLVGKIKDLSARYHELQNQMGSLNRQMQDLWVTKRDPYHYSFRNPIQMGWTEVLAMQEIVNQMIELRGEAVDVRAALDKAVDEKEEMLGDEEDDYYGEI